MLVGKLRMTSRYRERSSALLYRTLLARVLTSLYDHVATGPYEKYEEYEDSGES